MAILAVQENSVPSNDSGVFKTSAGTIYVSKPYRSKASKKLRALVSFTPRNSVFDINDARLGANEFRGFYSLFWVSIFIFTLNTYVHSIEVNGRPLKLDFFAMISEDAMMLALSDAVIVLGTGICVPFALALKNGYIRYHWTGLLLQHLLQTAILLAAITWTFNRQWPWVQSGFLTLHSLVMIMKMHSYISVNGHMQDITEQSQILLAQMSSLTQTAGGWDSTITAAKERCQQVNASFSPLSSTSSSSTGDGTPMIPEGSTTSYIDAKAAESLRGRLASVALESKLQNKNMESSQIGSSDRIEQYSVPLALHPLVDHPDSNISAMAQDYSELQSELTSPGPEFVKWPNNIGWKNFALYQLIPTLVYELEYPRTDRIRPFYLFEKTVATFGTFVLLYTVTESFILPYTPTAEQSFFRSLLDLALPFMMAYLLLFYIVFVSLIGSFMKIGWNSTSWEEFSRKWNKPVHAFLLQHVYAASIMSYKVSRTAAMFFTFLLSAGAHELVMVVVTQKFRFYLFTLQIVQIPLIMLSRIPVIRRNKILGNIVFWLGLYAGFPLLCVAYVAY